MVWKRCAFLFTFFAAITLPKKIITTSRKRKLPIVSCSKPATRVFGQLQTHLCAGCSAVPLFPQTLSTSPFPRHELFQISSFSCLPHSLMGRVRPRASRGHLRRWRPSPRQAGPTLRAWRAMPRRTQTLKTLHMAWMERDWGRHELCPCRHPDNEHLHD